MPTSSQNFLLYYNCTPNPRVRMYCLVTLPSYVAKLEMVQRRVARFVTNNYDRTASVTQMLHSLQWDTLEARHNNLHAVLLYKIINKMVDIQQPEGLLMLTNSITRGHSLRYLQPPTKINAYKYSFSPQPSGYGTPYHHMWSTL